jgi:hypothetical protein
MTILNILIICIFLPACAHIKRSEKSGYASATEQPVINRVTAPENQDEKLDRATTIRRLESKLDSRREKEQYSKILPLLENESEKLDYLSLPDLDARQSWIKSNDIWKRSQKLASTHKTLVENGDIAVGMNKEFVRKSWGEPQSTDVSGNPLYQNERWKYVRQVSSPDGYRQERRYVYFEGGRVSGWETE